MANWNSSKVMSDFEKIAVEKGLIQTDFVNKDYVGNASETPMVKDHTRNEPTEEYDITKETGKDLIEKAHKKSPTVADAMGKGGVVRNEAEKQERDIEIALKMPNGALFGVHANLINNLVKLANTLEDEGKFEEAKRVDETIGRIAARPFDKIALFPAFLGAIPLWAKLTGAVGGGIYSGAFGWIGKKLTSFRDSLTEDTKDLIEAFQKAEAKGANSAQEAITILQPVYSAFSSANLKDAKGMETYAKEMYKLASLMPKVEATLGKVKIEIGSSRWFHFGLDITSRLEQKIEDVKKGLEESKQLIAQAQNIKTEQPAPAPQGNLKDLQKSLLAGDVNAGVELEKILDQKITEKNTGLKGTMIGKVVKDGKMIIDPAKLNEIIDLLG